MACRYFVDTSFMRRNCSQRFPAFHLSIARREVYEAVHDGWHCALAYPHTRASSSVRSAVVKSVGKMFYSLGVRVAATFFLFIFPRPDRE